MERPVFKIKRGIDPLNPHHGFAKLKEPPYGTLTEDWTFQE